MTLVGSYDDSVAAWRGRDAGFYFVQGDWTGFIVHMSIAKAKGDSSAHVFQLRIATDAHLAFRIALYGQSSFASDWATV